MKATAILFLCSAAALASAEDVSVSDAVLIKNPVTPNDLIKRVDFKLHHGAATTTCSVKQPKYPNPDNGSYAVCKDPNYSFRLTRDENNEYIVLMYNKVNRAWKEIGKQDLELQCENRVIGGNEYTCTQIKHPKPPSL